jgi:hypothetical protein
MSYDLKIGERVRVVTSNPAYEYQLGAIMHITKPFVATESMRVAALFEMPLYVVQLDDGRHIRLRGRDLETMNVAMVTSG